jgi:hypothetical protein
MTASVLENICTERDQARDAAVAMAESPEFNPEDPTFLDLQARAQDLDKRALTLNGLLEQRAAADALDGKMAKATQQRARVTEQPQTRQSLGDIFTRSEEFSGYRFKGSSGVLTIDDYDVQTRALPTGMSDLIAAGLTGTKTVIDTTAPVPPTPLIDNCTNITVSGNAIEYVSWALKAGSAATVAEKAAKPSVEFGPTVTPATLEMIAAYTQLTRQMIEDFSAVRSQIDGELRREIAREEEEHAAAALAAATLPTATGDDLVSAVRIGIATVQSAGYSPNAALMNPVDYAEMDIAVMGATLLGPTVRSTFWGVTPIPSTVQPAGTVTVGDFRAGVHHYNRSAINLFVTDSHADTFLTNVFTILAERRSKTVVVRPAALVEVTAA